MKNHTLIFCLLTVGCGGAEFSALGTEPDTDAGVHAGTGGAPGEPDAGTYSVTGGRSGTGGAIGTGGAYAGGSGGSMVDPDAGGAGGGTGTGGSETATGGTTGGSGGSLGSGGATGGSGGQGGSGGSISNAVCGNGTNFVCPASCTPGNYCCVTVGVVPFACGCLAASGDPSHPFTCKG